MAKILIDMQACQTESRQRGMGRYAMALAKAMAIEALSRNTQIHLLLNSCFKDTVPHIKRNFLSLVSDENIHVISNISPNEDRLESNRWRKNASYLIREAYIEMLRPDIVFYPSFFEGYIDDAVLSIAKFSNVPFAATIHDFIPLVHRRQYLDTNPDFARHYLGKIEELKSAVGLIAISEFSASEAERHLNFGRDRIVNASEAADPAFCRLSTSDVGVYIQDKFAVTKPFVLYTGGADPRKNLEKLIEAFARLPAAVRNEHQLVFAGFIPEFERLTLEKVARSNSLTADEIKLLGYVSDEDLIKLYNSAKVFVFPSLHEGFGLPCLEAYQCGLSVIGSNVTSLPEVIGNPDALFDPLSVPDMMEKLSRVLTDTEFRNALIKHGASQAKKFSWSRSACLALDALECWADAANPSKIKTTSWQKLNTENDAIEGRLIAALADIDTSIGKPTERDQLQAAQLIADNRQKAEANLRLANLSQPIQWRIEGPYDSSYSLALVNRELARAFHTENIQVSLWSSEGPGDFDPSGKFLEHNPDLAVLHQRAVQQQPNTAEIISRNMYPPRVTDMRGRLNALHNYAWEETGFPFSYVRSFNESLQFITVTSEHVKRILINNGVSVPIFVVGNGIDHWTSIKAASRYALPRAVHTFLHVSSCFPRKGVDVLLKSYGIAFSNKDDVLLVIKTFRNPHNRIEEQLAELRSANPEYPKVHLIFDDLSDGELKGLYEQCNTLVAPSRAEGFGLPLAEAMLSGLHVITTGWSGQLDFCTTDNADLIDYTFAPAATHEADKPASVWAEPDVNHLALLLQRRFEANPDRAERKLIATKLLETYNWCQVAKRNVQAAALVSNGSSGADPHIGWVSTFNKRCGIATYSQHLLDVLEMPVTVLAGHAYEVTSRDNESVVRCWHEGNSDSLDELLAQIDSLSLNMIVIQFNYGFFNFEAFSALLMKLIERRIRIVVTMHATIDPKHDPEKRLAKLIPALKLCDRLLVHSIHDLNRLKAYGLVDNVCLFPHGVVVPERILASSDGSALNIGKTITIGTYGFFLPNKGLLETIQAVHILRSRGLDYRLVMVNSQFPVEVSAQEIEQARSLIRRYKLEAYVELETSFLSDEESLRRLSRTDAIMYAYQGTGESASGAVRYGLASGKPVITTPLPIFQDVSDVVFSLPGISPTDIAAGLEIITSRLRKREAEACSILDRASSWRRAHGYPVLGERLAGLLRGIFRDKRCLEKGDNV